MYTPIKEALSNIILNMQSDVPAREALHKAIDNKEYTLALETLLPEARRKTTRYLFNLEQIHKCILEGTNQDFRGMKIRENSARLIGHYKALLLRYCDLEISILNEMAK